MPTHLFSTIEEPQSPCRVLYSLSPPQADRPEPRHPLPKLVEPGCEERAARVETTLPKQIDSNRDTPSHSPLPRFAPGGRKATQPSRRPLAFPSSASLPDGNACLPVKRQRYSASTRRVDKRDHSTCWENGQGTGREGGRRASSSSIGSRATTHGGVSARRHRGRDRQQQPRPTRGRLLASRLTSGSTDASEPNRLASRISGAHLARRGGEHR